MRQRVPDRAQWRPVDWIPRPRQPAVPILPVVPGVTHTLVVLSESLYDVWTHFVYPQDCPRGRTVPCTGEGATCHVNHETTTLRWLGWLHVRRTNVQESRLLRLTPTAVSSEPQLADRALCLRGLTLTVGRTGSWANAPIWARLDAESQSVDLRVGPVDIGAQLAIMWNAPPRRVDTKASWAQILRDQGEKGGKS